MKVLSYDFGFDMSPHPETEADFLQQHLDHGDEVVRMVCKGELPTCIVNPGHDLLRCVSCVCRRTAAVRLLSRKVPEKSVFRLTPRDRKVMASFSFDGERLGDLRKLTYGSFDIGLAVISVLVDETRDPSPDLTVHRQRVNDWIAVSLATYLSALNTLAEEKPDRVYVFNGRWSYTRAVLRACQERGVECCLHERGGELNRYLMVTNCLPHEIAPYRASMEKVWSQADPAARETVGAEFFEGKAKGIERQWFSFVADQKKGLLPDDWDPSRRNIAVFMTSEFEFAAIGPEYDNKLYKDQNDGLDRIIAAFEEKDAPVHLYLRVHPNMKGLRNANLDHTLAIRSRKATVIPPESPVSSYGLLLACEKTLTFGSTMGIEAVYWGKPSVLAGPSYFQDLGGTYNPDSHEELVALLLAELSPKPKEAALNYGYHELRKGVEFVDYRPETPWKGKYKGWYLDDRVPWFWRMMPTVLRARQMYYSGAMARTHCEQRRLICRQLGLPMVHDRRESQYPVRAPFHKRLIDKCLRKLLGFVVRFPTGD